jgi:hypothetical protein
MKATKNAIVILYEGQMPDDSTVAEIANVLELDRVCDINTLTIKCLDEESVAKALVNTGVLKNATVVVKDEKKLSERTKKVAALENAVTYIKGLFSKDIENKGVFGLVLYDVARHSVGETRTQLYNAIEIIAKADKATAHNLKLENLGIFSQIADTTKKVYEYLK